MEHKLQTERPPLSGFLRLSWVVFVQLCVPHNNPLVLNLHEGHLVRILIEFNPTYRTWLLCSEELILPKERPGFGPPPDIKRQPLCPYNFLPDMDVFVRPVALTTGRPVMQFLIGGLGNMVLVLPLEVT